MNLKSEVEHYKVCVRCFTFNHSEYILETLNGFVMQQTDFPYVCCIIDDASTDGEQDVIRKFVVDSFDLSEGSCHFERETDYAFITYAQHKANKNCYFAVLYLKENHHSIKKPKMPYLTEWEDICEYAAICEGDDYWTDSFKLQKQVEFLDNNPEYVLSHTAFDIFQQSTRTLVPCGTITNNNLEILRHNENIPLAVLDNTRYRIQTMTVVFRTSVYNLIIPDLGKQSGMFLMGDTQLWIFLLKYGRIHFLPDITATYRIHTGSACNQESLSKRLRFDLSCSEMRVYMSGIIGAPHYFIKRMQRQLQIRLIKYRSLHPEYEPCCNLEFNNPFEIMLFSILSSRVSLSLIRLVVKFRYR